MANEGRSRRFQREPRKPELIARAKIGNGWSTVGAAWRLKGDQHGFSVKLNTIPVGAWDGRFVLVHPLPDDDEERGQQPQEDD